MRKSTVRLLTVFTLSLWVSTANADLIPLVTSSAELSVDSVLTEIDMSNAPARGPTLGTSVTVQVQEFNAALGALQSIDLNFDGVFTGDLSAVFFPNYPICVSGNCRYDYGFQAEFVGSVTGPNGIDTIVQTSIVDVAKSTLYGPGGGGSPGSLPPAATSSFIGNPSGPGLSYPLGVSPFAPFVGNGNGLWDLKFMLALTSVDFFIECTNLTIGGSDCNPTSGDPFLEGRGLEWGLSNIEVVYSYIGPDRPSTVSAPATLALFGLGLAGLSWLRRKKA